MKNILVILSILCALVMMPVSAMTDVDEQFVDAVADCDAANVTRLVADGANVNIVRTKDGTIPLHRAAIFCSPEIVRTLVQSGANLDAKEKNGFTPLHFASGAGYIFASRASDPREKNENLPFGDAYTDIATSIVNEADSNKIGNLIDLIEETRKSEIENAIVLIQSGADVNVKDDFGDTPLHYATSKILIKALVAAGADVNARNEDGKAPLLGASLEAVMALIEAGADVNAKDNNGDTSLHIIANAPIVYGNSDSTFAASVYRMEAEVKVKVTNALIEAGADASAINKKGLTPLDVAKKTKNWDVGAILEKSIITNWLRFKNSTNIQ